MRLSDAIAMGRCLIEPRSGGRRSAKRKKGCALDMGMEAVYGGCWHEAWRVWPWLNKQCRDGYGSETWMNRVADRFDTRVMVLKTETLEQFIDWVRSVEPAELTEETPTTVEVAAEATPRHQEICHES